MTSIPSPPFKLPLLEGTPATVYLTVLPSWVAGTWRLATVPGASKGYPANWPAPQVSGWTDSLSWSGGSAPASPAAASSISVSTAITGGERRITISYNGGPLNSGTNAQGQPLYAPFGMFASQNPVANIDGAGNLLGSEMDTMKDNTPVPFVVVPFPQNLGPSGGNTVITPPSPTPGAAYRVQMFLTAAVATESPVVTLSGITPLPTVTPIMSNGYLVGYYFDGTAPSQPGSYTISLNGSSTFAYVSGETLKNPTTVSRFGGGVFLTVASAADTTAPIITKLYLGAGQGGTWSGDHAPTSCVAQDTGSGISRFDYTLTMSVGGQSKTTNYTTPIAPPSTAVQGPWLGEYHYGGDALRPWLREISPFPSMVFIHDASGVGNLVSSATVTDAAGNAASRSINATLYIPTLVSWNFSGLTAANNTLNVAWMGESSVGGLTYDMQGVTVTITTGGKGITELGYHLELSLDGTVLAPATANSWVIPATLADGAHTLSAQISQPGGSGPAANPYTDAPVHIYNFTQLAAGCTDGGGCDGCNNCNDGGCGYDCPGDVGCFDASCSSRG